MFIDSWITRYRIIKHSLKQRFNHFRY